MTSIIETRPAFVEANPALQAQHRAAQRALFAAANHAEMSRDRDDQLEGINAALALRGAQRLISRRQMSIEEMNAITVAIEAGLFSDDWTWGHDFTITVTTRIVQASLAHIEMRDTVTGEVRHAFHTATIEPVTADDTTRFSRLVSA